MTETQAAPAGDMASVFVATISQQIEQANALVSRIASATSGDEQSQIMAIVFDMPTEQIEDTETRQQLEKFRVWHANTMAKVEQNTANVVEQVKKNLASQKTEEVDVDALRAQYKDLTDGIKSARNWFKTTPFASDDIETKIPELKSLRGSTVKTGTDGTGSRKPRFEMAFIAEGNNPSEDAFSPIFKEIEKDGEKRKASNFTILAQYLSSKVGEKVTATELQDAAIAEARTDNLNTLKGVPFSFVVNYGEGEKRKTFTIKIKPKSE